MRRRAVGGGRTGGRGRGAGTARGRWGGSAAGRGGERRRVAGRGRRPSAPRSPRPSRRLHFLSAPALDGGENWSRRRAGSAGGPGPRRGRGGGARPAPAGRRETLPAALPSPAARKGVGSGLGCGGVGLRLPRMRAAFQNAPLLAAECAASSGTEGRAAGAGGSPAPAGGSRPGGRAVG